MAVRDTLTWIATYTDGSEFPEFDVDGGDHSFVEVAQDRVHALRLVDAEGNAVLAVLIPLGATPVCFRRRTIALNTDGTEGWRSSRTCLGWERDGAGAYLWLYPDGSIILSASRD